MNRTLLAAGLCLVASVPAAAQERPEGPRGEAVGRGTLRGYANPSAVIAAELALDRDAAARGQWTALAATAAPAAVVFTPAPGTRIAWARDWLKGRANPPVAERWQSRSVWSSCDGALVVSRGTWRAGDRGGWFARMWQRQGDGSYKWLVTRSGAEVREDAEPDMIAAQVAECPARKARDEDEPHRKSRPPKPARAKDLPPLDPLRHGGASPDGSLRWEASVGGNGGPHLTAVWRKDGAEQALPVDGMAGSSPPPNLR